MDGQQYLDQIAESSRPIKQTGGKGGFSLSNLLHSKFFIIGAACVSIFILLAIIGSALNSGKSSEKELCYSLKLHLEGTTEIIQEYQEYLRSSTLRSSSASLQGVFTNTNTKLTTYLEDIYDFRDKDIDEKITEEADLAKDELNNELFNAKINGNLDRIFAYKMSYEISVFLAEEGRLLDLSKNEELTNLLNESHSSLNNLYDNFNNFSETKN